MLLAVDAGNTNVVFSIFDGEALRAKWRASSDPKRTADEYAVWLTQLMTLEDLRPSDVTQAIIANVVPAAAYHLTALCESFFQTKPMVIGDPKVDLGIEVRMERPENVGADRLVNAVAAHHSYGGPLIAIDFGTATTFDIIGPDGAYEGGVIAPSAQHSSEALYRAAAQLPRVKIERPERVIGKDTVPGMKSGIYWGYVGLIEGLVARIREEYGQPMKVIATGGLAPVYAEATSVIEAVDQDLTLRGLCLIHAANTGD
ncbi:MAG TPA: type III pantothenate kinase [Kiloniellaceae bacterium]|nr:type III pantothenate kinase [Kiloniellaceae bacterium]